MSQPTRHNTWQHLLVIGTLAFFWCTAPLTSIATPPRVLPAGQTPNDSRLAPPKDLDGYFPFTPPASRDQWAKRAEQVRQQILVSQGLWPMPSKAPLKPVIHGTVDRGDYTVENVYFESFPGFFVTGNLYRPKGKSGKLPAVLSPHGHWNEGRFHDNPNVRQQIIQGAERFEEGGRSPLQARCVQLARMGTVVFHYDMVGYADSEQISFELAHRFAKQRPEMNTLENWGFYSTQAEAHLQSIMGLQTFNSIRALDFVLSLPEVDPQRVAVTGASGGGTQTFILCAIDPRPALSFPAVMVSTAMQGGCTCENSSLLRVNTGNIEFAALFAPKPLGLTAADDWTREMASKGFPELKQHYKFMGAPDSVMLKALTHFEHNYNYVSRAALYHWINKHFKLGLQEPIVEEDYKRLSRQELSVWNSQHPKPESGPEFERKLLRSWTEDAQNQLKQAQASPDQFAALIRPALDALIGRTLDSAGQVDFTLKDKSDRGAYLEMTGLLRNSTHNEELPTLFLFPKEWSGRTVIWLSNQGKNSLYTNSDANSPLLPEVQKLVTSGAAVAGIDLLFQGEFLLDGKPIAQTRKVKNTREFAGYTFGYNHPLFAQRVHDVLSLIRYIQNHERRTEKLQIVALDGTGPIAAAALAQAPKAAQAAVINTEGFRFGKLVAFHDPNFLPGGAKYGDLPGFLALAAPTKLLLAGEGSEVPPLIRSFHKEGNATTTSATGPALRQSALEWLSQ